MHRMFGREEIIYIFEETSTGGYRAVDGQSIDAIGCGLKQTQMGNQKGET